MTAAGRPRCSVRHPLKQTIVTAVVVWCAVRGAIVLLPPPPWEPATGLLCVAAKKGRVGQLNRDKEQKETKKKWFMCGTFPHSLSGSKKKKNIGGDNRASNVLACGKVF